MNNKPDCHPEKPESGQQANRQAKLDTSEHGTLVPPNRQETLDSYRACLSCKHFKFLDPLFCGEVGYCSSKKEYLFPMKHCRRYEPRNQ